MTCLEGKVIRPFPANVNCLAPFAGAVVMCNEHMRTEVGATVVLAGVRVE